MYIVFGLAQTTDPITEAVVSLNGVWAPCPICIGDIVKWFQWLPFQLLGENELF